jgi:hypothetical protein
MIRKLLSLRQPCDARVRTARSGSAFYSPFPPAGRFALKRLPFAYPHRHLLDRGAACPNDAPRSRET